MIVQVYGLTTPDDAVMVATLGADHIGLVAGVRGRTPDEVDFATARAILAEDPFAKAGLFKSLDLRAWRWGWGKPA